MTDGRELEITMAVHKLAGKQAPKSLLVDVPKLVSAYYTDEPDAPVSFGTSGHRGTSLEGGFNELHIASTAQAICEFRARRKITGPLFLGFDTHALSEPAFRTSLEVFAANGVNVMIHKNDEYTPTPVISFHILEHNRNCNDRFADGVVITPSHNPPQDGGFKYNPPNGGPADVDVTVWIQNRANEIMAAGGKAIERTSYRKARSSPNIREMNFMTPFIESLEQVVDMTAIADAKIKIGADPLGGSGVHYWEPIAEKYGLNLEVVNRDVDPAFAFMPVDADGLIRMDCSSPYAMAGLIAMAGKFDIAWGNDPDFDRHGIVCPSGLMNPNHYLASAIWYLVQNRPNWKPDMKIGKTLVGSSMIDKVANGLNRQIYEVPVGFKWFVDGLQTGTVCFGGEESAGASMLRMNGTPWCTDKDGFCMTLLAAEILARTGRTPDEIYNKTLVKQYGAPFYKRDDRPISDKRRSVLKGLTPESVKAEKLAGLKIAGVMTRAAGNDAPIGGVKVVLEDGSWFALRPSGTEPKMKYYIESFGGEELWEKIRKEALPLIFD